MLVLSESGYRPELSEDERAEWQRRSRIELANPHPVSLPYSRVSPG